MGRHSVSVIGRIDIGAQRGGRLASVRSVGRVGALAVALGVGAAVVSVPLASADTTGSAGSAGSDSAAPDRGAATKAGDRGLREPRVGDQGSRPAAGSGDRRAEGDGQTGAPASSAAVSPRQRGSLGDSAVAGPVVGVPAVAAAASARAMVAGVEWVTHAVPEVAAPPVDLVAPVAQLAEVVGAPAVS